MKPPLIPLSHSDISIANKYHINPIYLRMFKWDKEELALAISLANDDRMFRVYANTSDKVVIFSKPYDFYIMSIENNTATVLLKFKTCRVLTQIKYTSPHDLLNKLSSWMFIRGRYVRDKNVVMSKHTDIVEFTSDVQSVRHYHEKFKEYYGEFGLLALWMYAFGVKPKQILESEDGRLNSYVVLFLARLMPLISPVPVHVFEISTPASGKTTTALLYKSIYNWEFYNEPPSLATLIGDARSGVSKISSVNGIWFDEFEKWFAKISSLTIMTEIMETILTGMEQGLWKRSKGGINTIEVHRHIPVYLSGNIPLTRENPRKFLSHLISRAVRTAGEAFADRVAVALGFDVKPIIPYIVGYRHSKIFSPRPSFLKGLYEYTVELYKVKSNVNIESDLEGRMARHHVNVAKALMALVDTDDVQKVVDFARMLVKGRWFGGDAGDSGRQEDIQGVQQQR